jgi:hypothetical protein
MDSDPIIGLLHVGRMTARYAEEGALADEKWSAEFSSEIAQALNHLSKAIGFRQGLLGRDVGPVFACKR